MEQELKLKLVTGDFSLKDANDLLLELFRFKIRFHEDKLLGDYQRYGRDSSNSKERIEQLRENISQIRAFLAQSRELGQELELDCEMVIKSKVPKAQA